MIVFLGRILTLTHFCNSLTSLSHDLFIYLPYMVMRFSLYGYVEDIQVENRKNVKCKNPP